MALTLSSISSVVLAKNLVGVKLTTDNYLITPASVASITLTFTRGGLDGEVISLAWNGIVVEFVFVSAAPDGSGMQLPAYVSGTVSAWLNTIIPYMLKNYYLYKDFDVARGIGDTIFIEAKITGTVYNITLPQFYSGVSGAPAAGTDAVYQENFSVNLEVLLEKTVGAALESSGNMSLIVNSANQAVFFIETFLKAYLSSQIPTYGQTTITKCINLYKRWMVRYAEAFGYGGSAAIFQAVTDSAVYTAINAGVSFIDYPGNAYFATWLPANKKFMTWAPANQIVSKTQHEFLNYLVFGSSVTSLVLKGKCYYSDGTNQTVTLLTQTGVAQKEIYMFPAGYTQLGIESKFTIPSAQTVLKYELWLIDQASNVISEVRTYRIEEFSSLEERAFLFENSFSAMDSLLCRGLSEDNFETSGVEAERMLADYWNLSAFDGQGTYFNAQSSSVGRSVVRTGNYLSKADVLWLKELLLSNLVMELRGGKYVPVKLKRGSFKLFEPGQDVFYLEFEVGDGWSERNYSKLT